MRFLLLALMLVTRNRGCHRRLRDPFNPVADSLPCWCTVDGIESLSKRQEILHSITCTQTLNRGARGGGAILKFRHFPRPCDHPPIKTILGRVGQSFPLHHVSVTSDSPSTPFACFYLHLYGY